ncbi:MAG: hypothetical protein H6819_11950 [Phycisphaerales bacterium]|nr:hypothetical protein [Phycisphaerales bacterium]MCB9858058.1 hypothetical protein [Phycisphaerales bacterium]MCB9864155.1 hypothetical protein [Phycisphaerales bacterium]
MIFCSHFRRSAWCLLAMALLGTRLVAQTQPGTPPAPPMDPVQAIDAALRAIETGDLQTADRLIRDVSITNPKMSRLNLANGMLAMELRRYPEAIEALGTYNATDEGRRDYRGWAAVGTVYLKSYMYSSAVGPLEEALKLAPESEKDGTVYAKIALDLARTNLGLSDRKQAKAAIEKAKTTAPGDGDIQADVCELAFQAGDEATARSAGNAAVQAFSSELGVNPLSVTAHRGLARCYQVMLSMQSTAISKDPNNGAAFIEGAKLLSAIANVERRSRLLDARSLVLQALETNASSVDWQLLAASYELELGAMSEARARIDGVLQSNPDNAEALALKNRLAPAGG